MYTEDKCLEALNLAAEKIGHSPSKDEYNRLDIEPKDANTIADKLGSWNRAKELAELEVFNGRRRINTKTKFIDRYISDKEWEELPPATRSRLSKKSKLSRLKVEVGCERCGYDENPVPLEFHHRNRDNKSFNVCRDFARKNIDWEKVKEEMKKCDILCANCHRLEEAKYFK